MRAFPLLLHGGLALARRIPRHATVVDRDAVASAYDFVIAGGGIAGLTVADRLTEDPNVRVLVLEAGPLDSSEDGVLVPGAYNPSAYLWPGLLTVPQTALNNQVYLGICGRVVGGGSTVNAMIFTRGDQQDYADWSQLGNEGWSWSDLLPYFQKSENFTSPDAELAAQGNISWVDQVHGHAGPVQVAYPNYIFPGSGIWWTAALQSGLQPDEDPNDGTARGLFALPLAEDASSRTRSYARTNHYERVRARSNYHLLPDTTVAKVLFDNQTASGVQYLPTAGGNTSTVAASREVLLAAGGLHTPQILQLSGVGPQALLASFGIDVVSDLPGVGQNFQDQPTIPMTYNFSQNVEPNWGSLLNNASYDAEQRARYDRNKTGPYTLVRTVSTNFATLSLQDATDQFGAIAAAARARNATENLPAGTDPTVAAGYHAQRTLLLQQLESAVGVGGLQWNTYATTTVFAFKPFSRGTVAVASTDPLAHPVVDFRAATDPTDLDVYAALVRKSRAVMAAPAMAALGPVENAPFGADVQSDDALHAALRTALSPTNGHECCTAAMLPRARGGVVDDQLRVYGVQRLRVIDISYFPLPVTGAPSATLYATGEKVADLLKQQYGGR